MNAPLRTFDTGATRDTDTGKPDYEGFLSPLVIEAFGRYMHKHRVQPDGTLRDSDNWQKGMPADVYVKSGWRHFLDWWKAHRADDATPAEIEEACCALLFNVQGYLHETLSRAREIDAACAPWEAGDPDMPADVQTDDDAMAASGAIPYAALASSRPAPYSVSSADRGARLAEQDIRVGDRVRWTGGGYGPVGREGRVVAGKTSLASLLVDFFGWSGGHDGYGRHDSVPRDGSKSRWYCTRSDLKILERALQVSDRVRWTGQGAAAGHTQTVVAVGGGRVTCDCDCGVTSSYARTELERVS